MRRDPSYLVDMLLAARNAVEIVGEAASRLTAETKEELPGIEWGKVIGMRHRLVHDYFTVDYDILWEVVQNDLPKLVSQLEAIVPPKPS